MTASELVEKLQRIIKEEGDFEVEYLDFEGYGNVWPHPIEHVQLQKNNTFKINNFKTIIGVY